MGQPQPLFRLFLVFSNKQYDIYKKSMWKMSKCPSSIQHPDSNPQPFEHESSPITTRPGLHPFMAYFCSKDWTENWFLTTLIELIISLNPIPVSRVIPKSFNWSVQSDQCEEQCLLSATSGDDVINKNPSKFVLYFLSTYQDLAQD